MVTLKSKNGKWIVNIDGDTKVFDRLGAAFNYIEERGEKKE